ncbi:uncharacterized protein [Rutidosis leptorrhynchoides]|uniref:uncharacterized protein n=1 Tax=Rutidosis leptorrhynchoides TaxID=125765 RepID=UPI003A991405
MKILSLNVRRFVVKGKFGWVRSICINERPSIAVFQETKCGSLNDNWVECSWGESNFGYAQKEVVGRFGGLLAIRGKWKSSSIESTIVNIYGPHHDREKKLMWDLLDRMLNSVATSWLLVGDFNEVRDASDRLNSQFHQGRADRFNDFIMRNGLVEIGISRRKFIRVSDDGVKFSKLDRFLVSDNFFHIWEDPSVIALDHHLSDHCPLVMRDKVLDYGPKPFKVFDEWFNCDEIDSIITDAWKQPIEALEWEIKAESHPLSDSDRGKWLECRRRWIKKERTKSSMLKQKARIKWTLEGDDNSKFFHASIQRKYNKCNIRGININGDWKDDPNIVKEAVFEHFKSIFSCSNVNMPCFNVQNFVGPNPWAETVQHNETTRPVGPVTDDTQFGPGLPPY